jgi:hypothetical protein
METKICSQCKEEKPLSEFYVRNNRPGKHMSTCKSCDNEKQRIYRSINNDRVCNYRRKYYQENHEKLMEQKKEYRQKGDNAKKSREYSKKWYRENLDRVKKYYQENKDNFTRNRIKRTYGISIEELDKIRKSQNNKCAICGKGKELFVDHNHNSKKVRGYLCNECNLVLGFANDSIEILEKAITYLRSRDV